MVQESSWNGHLKSKILHVLKEKGCWALNKSGTYDCSKLTSVLLQEMKLVNIVGGYRCLEQVHSTTGL